MYRRARYAQQQALLVILYLVLTNAHRTCSAVSLGGCPTPGTCSFFAQVDKVFASGGKISTSGDQKKDVRTSLQRRARIAVPCTATSRECQLRHSAHPMYRAIYRLAHFWQSADPPGRLSARASALLGISF
jgi:hypothetical protein